MLRRPPRSTRTDTLFPYTTLFRSEAHALGRSKGGLSTKIHAATDALGNPVRFLLTGGERNDITQIEGLLDGLQARHVLADKGYDGQRAMGAIAASGAKPVVPRRRTTAQWRSFRSEEHTSELQSLMRISYAVFCLKKKNH